LEMGHFIFSIIVIIIVEDDVINKYIWHAIKNFKCRRSPGMDQSHL